MSAVTCSCLRSVINLGNSIIGVSILAMPYCFKKCGIFLSILLIVASGLITRAACHLVLKSAIMARRRNFEFLAFHTFGSTGKLAVEIGIIGFLIGVCVAFFVVVGDLGPVLTAKFLMIENTTQLRAEVLIFLGVFVAFPLGLLRKVDSLTSFSAISIGFYLFLILTIVAEALPKLVDGEWWRHVTWWRPAGLLSSLPIFSMALSCQTQLFEFFDPLTDPSLKKMNSVINGAVQMCSAVYISVGLFGYIAFHDNPITGNILVRLTPSLTTEVIKLGFILSIVISFPLCLFPCRSSLHSLIFKQGVGHYDLQTSYMPDHRFRMLTCALVTATIGTAIMVPNIEFVLGLVGSTIGITICVILPALIFLHLTSKNTNERRMAQLISFIGFFILIACTFSTLQENYKPEEISNSQNFRSEDIVKSVDPAVTIANHIAALPKKATEKAEKEEKANSLDKRKEPVPVKAEKQEENKEDESKRQEPPVPQEVIEKNPLPLDKVKNADDLDPEALKKEDKEIYNQKKGEESEKVIDKRLNKQEELLQKLEAQHIEQKKILEEQKKLLQELKMHKESHDEEQKIKNIDQALPNQLPQNNLQPSPQTINTADKDKIISKKVLEVVKETIPVQNEIVDKKHQVDSKGPVQKNIQEQSQQQKMDDKQYIADSAYKQKVDSLQRNEPKYNAVPLPNVEVPKDLAYKQADEKNRKLLSGLSQEENLSKNKNVQQVENSQLHSNKIEVEIKASPKTVDVPYHPDLSAGNLPGNVAPIPKDSVVQLVEETQNLSSKVQLAKLNEVDNHRNVIKKREIDSEDLNPSYKQGIVYNKGTLDDIVNKNEINIPIKNDAGYNRVLDNVVIENKVNLPTSSADTHQKNNEIKQETSSSSSIAKHEMRRLLSQNLSSTLLNDHR